MEDSRSGVDQFLVDIQANRWNRAILDAWDVLDLKEGWLVAGCLFQTVWNLRSGRAAEEQIKDYDIFYFDDSDLSAAAEASVQKQVDDLLGSRGVQIEVKNQARVHLWYEKYFGYSYPKLASATDGIDRFLILSTCVRVRRCPHSLELYAPNGLSELYAGILSPNPLTLHLPLFWEKAASYKSRWEWLKVCNTP